MDCKNETYLKDLIAKIRAGGSTEADAQWSFRSVDEEAVLKAIEENLLTMISAIAVSHVCPKAYDLDNI